MLSLHRQLTPFGWQLSPRRRRLPLRRLNWPLLLPPRRLLSLPDLRRDLHAVRRRQHLLGPPGFLGLGSALEPRRGEDLIGLLQEVFLHHQLKEDVIVICKEKQNCS